MREGQAGRHLWPPDILECQSSRLYGLLFLATDRRGECCHPGLFQEWHDPPDPRLLHEGEGGGDSGEWMRELYEAGRFGWGIKPKDL